MSLGHSIGDLKVFLGLDVTGFQKGARSAETSLTRLDSRARSFSNTMKGLISGVAFHNLGKALFEIGTLNQQIDVSMRAVTGSYEEGREAIEFVRTESERLGLVFQSQIRDFRLLTAAAQGTTLSMEEVRNLFSAIAEMGTVLQLPADTISGAMYAVQQIISKGVVQAEELRGQLGERLPGAFQIAARAMNMTTMELNKFMADGLFKAEDFVRSFADEIRRTYGKDVPDAARLAQSEMNRLNNALFTLNSTVMNLKTMDTLAASIRGVTDQFANWIRKNDDLIKQHVDDYIKSIASSLSLIKSIYDVLPEGLVGATGFGILGAILFGGSVGKFVGAMYFVNTYMEKIGMGLSEFVKRGKEGGEAFSNIWEVMSGNKNSSTGEWNFERSSVPMVDSLSKQIFQYENEIKRIEKRVAGGLFFAQDKQDIIDLKRDVVELERLRLSVAASHRERRAFTKPNWSLNDPDAERLKGMKGAAGRSDEILSYLDEKRKKEIEAYQKYLDELKKKEEEIRRMNEQYWDALASSYDPYKRDPDTERMNGMMEAAVRSGEMYRNAMASEMEHLFSWAKEEGPGTTWLDGAKAGLQEYHDMATNVFENVKDVFTNTFQNMEDTLVRFVVDGKFRFKDFMNSILEDMARLWARQLTGGIAAALSSGLSGGFGAPQPLSVTSGASYNTAFGAEGGVFSGPTSGYPATMHGKEAIVPLSGGRAIPVEMKGGGERVQVIVNNNTSEKATASQSTSSDGIRQIMVAIGNDIRKMGPVGQSIGSRFGLAARGAA